MKKGFNLSLLLLLFLLLTYSFSFAIATVSGTVTTMDLANRTMTIQMQSGAEKKVIFNPNCQAYKLNERTTLSNFRVGEQVVIKITNSLDESPLKAEFIMDKFSAQQYQSFKTVTPVNTGPAQGGGFATSGGAAPTGIPTITGVYPGSINNQLPSTVTWGQPTGGGSTTMTAAPSPWGSPEIGAVLSGSTSPGSTDWGNTGTGNVPSSVNTSGTVSGQVGGGSGSIMPDVAANQGVTPENSAWVVNPSKSAQEDVKMVTLQGKVYQFDSNIKAIYITELATNKVYTVVIKSNTKILDHLTQQPITLNQIQVGHIVQVKGIASSNNVLDAFNMVVQR